MTCLASFVLMLLVLWGLLVASARANRSARERRRYQEVARRFSGVYDPADWFHPASIRFQYGSTQVLVEVLGPSRHHAEMILQAQMDWPDGEPHCELVSPPHSAESPFRPTNIVRTGDPGFDGAFSVRGENHDQIARLLTRGLLWQADRLRRSLNRMNLHIVLGKGRLLIRKRVGGVLPPELEEFIQRSLELYDQAMLARAEGIEFIEPDEAQLVVDAKCQVCGEGIIEQMVVCRRCKTPHHHDCWLYFGACSTYGCQETHYAAPHTVLPIVSPDSPARDGGIPRSG